MKETMEANMTLLAIPKFCIKKPDIKAPNGPEENNAKEYTDKILPL